MQEGLKAVKNQYAAQGGSGSGGLFKSIANYSQGLAGTSFDKSYNRAANTFDMNHKNTLQALSTLAGYGQNAVGQSIGVGENYGNNLSRNYVNLGEDLAHTGMQGEGAVSDILLQRANAQAEGVLGKSNAITQGIQGVGQAGVSAWYNRKNPGYGLWPGSRTVTDPSRNGG